MEQTTTPTTNNDNTTPDDLARTCDRTLILLAAMNATIDLRFAAMERRFNEMGRDLSRSLDKLDKLPTRTEMQRNPYGSKRTSRF